MPVTPSLLENKNKNRLMSPAEVFLTGWRYYMAIYFPNSSHTWRSAMMLFGDWGTRKAYALGLAFALAGYQSFWLITALCIFTLLIGWNYFFIFSSDPLGGNLYAAARRHSDILALIGAFSLLSSYLVVAALSALSCFHYLGVMKPVYWAMGAVILIGILHFFGPRYTGRLILSISLLTLAVIIALACSAIPYIGQAISAVEPLSGPFSRNWDHFVSLIVFLSGIETVIHPKEIVSSLISIPSSSPLSKREFKWVILEVVVFTLFFGLMMHALPGLQIAHQQVWTVEGHAIRDSMLRQMGHYFVSQSWGEWWGSLFGYLVGGIFAVFLLSVVHTAMTVLVSLCFVMSRDGALPNCFQQLTPFGVPRIPLLLVILSICLLLFTVQDIAILSHLYAVGFIGSLLIALGVNVINQRLTLPPYARFIMWSTLAILLVIEITLLITKPDARRFAISIIVVGLLSRMLLAEYRQKQWTSRNVQIRRSSLFIDDSQTSLHEGPILCAVRTVGKTLHFAMQEAKSSAHPLYILFIREQKVLTEQDQERTWLDDEDACIIFDYLKDSASEANMRFLYIVSESPLEAIVETAKQLHITRLILGRPRQSAMLQFLRGNIVKEISDVLPSDIDLIVVS